ncbi:MAG: hypothetical protein ACRDL2_15765 [Gaiellaceae bacterium]
MKSLVVVFATALAIGVPSAAADGVWVGGTVHGLATAPPSASSQRPARLYVIAPVSGRHPLHPLADARTHGFGAHDHVAASVFSGPCDLTLVVPGPKAAKATVDTRMTLTPTGLHPLVYAVRLGGRMAPLTSTARIRRAEAARLVAAVDTHNVISCTIS